MNYEDRVTKEYVEGLLANGAKIAYGSYVGDGGTSRTIVFPFPPKLIIMQHAASDQWLAIDLLLRDSGKWNVLDFYGNRVTNYTADYTIDGCTLTIRGSTSAEGMDGADFRYDYLVIG